MFFYQKAYNSESDPLGRSRSRSPDFYAELRNNKGQFMNEKPEPKIPSRTSVGSRASLDRFYKVVSKSKPPSPRKSTLLKQ